VDETTQRGSRWWRGGNGMGRKNGTGQWERGEMALPK